MWLFGSLEKVQWKSGACVAKIWRKSVVCDYAKLTRRTPNPLRSTGLDETLEIGFEHQQVMKLWINLLFIAKFNQEKLCIWWKKLHLVWQCVCRGPIWEAKTYSWSSWAGRYHENVYSTLTGMNWILIYGMITLLQNVPLYTKFERISFCSKKIFFRTHVMWKIRKKLPHTKLENSNF